MSDELNQLSLASSCVSFGVGIIKHVKAMSADELLDVCRSTVENAVRSRLQAYNRVCGLLRLMDDEVGSSSHDQCSTASIELMSANWQDFLAVEFYTAAYELSKRGMALDHSTVESWATYATEKQGE